MSDSSKRVENPGTEKASPDSGKISDKTSTTNENSGQSADSSRLEKAVQDLLSVAKDEFSGRASTLLEDTTNKLQHELQLKRERDERIAKGSEREQGTHKQEAYITSEENAPRAPRTDRNSCHSRRSKRQRWKHWRKSRAGMLRRDVGHRKIAGVCSGIAKYRGIDAWVVRFIAVTGMIFIPQVTFPAYIVAWIVLTKEPRNKGRLVSEWDGGSEGVLAGGQKNQPASGKIDSGGGSLNDSSSNSKPYRSVSATERSPRHRLKNVQFEINKIELRLRRMESHVTSGYYELQKELNKIDV
ncbi:MAG: PspC domain-containing protein [Pseudomonadales bacterium]|nr:PspC domain-containing protein [Pseudomonadales bacterium]